MDNIQSLGSETNVTIISLKIHFWLIKGRKWTNSAWEMLPNSEPKELEGVGGAG